MYASVGRLLGGLRPPDHHNAFVDVQNAVFEFSERYFGILGSIFWILLERNLAPSWDTLMQKLVLDELAQYVSGLDELVQFVSGAMCLWEDKFTLSTSRHIAC